MSRFKYALAAAVGIFSAVIADRIFVESKRLDIDYSEFDEDTILLAVQEAKDYFAAEDKKHDLELTALQKHVLAFGKLNSKTHKVEFDAITTMFALRNMGEPLWPVIGFFVALGSKLQAGKCPIGTAELDTKKALHLGTSRLWDKDGNFDEVRWNRMFGDLKSSAPISQSKWNETVTNLVKDDQPETNTNREVGDGYIHSKKTQISTAQREAKEMFKLLGRKEGDDLVMPACLIKLYFEDTRAALMAVRTLKAESQKKISVQTSAETNDGSVWNSRAVGLCALRGR